MISLFFFQLPWLLWQNPSLKTNLFTLNSLIMLITCVQFHQIFAFQELGRSDNWESLEVLFNPMLCLVSFLQSLWYQLNENIYKFDYMYFFLYCLGLLFSYHCTWYRFQCSNIWCSTFFLLRGLFSMSFFSFACLNKCFFNLSASEVLVMNFFFFLGFFHMYDC